MVSGLVTSPCDQLRIFSGDARLMRMASKSAITFAISNGLERNKGILRFPRQCRRRSRSSLNKYSVRGTQYSVNLLPFHAALSSYAAVASNQDLFMHSQHPASVRTSLSTEYRVLSTALICRRAGRGLFLACLDQFHIEAERLQLADEYVKRFRHAGLHGGFALDDGLVNLGAAVYVVGLRRQQFLQDERRAVGFQRPDFHFSETLSAELRLAAQGLLGYERIRSDGTGVNLVVHQVRQLEHVDVAHGDGLFELLARHAVEQGRLARGGQAGVLEQRLDLAFFRSVEHRRSHEHALGQRWGHRLEFLIAHFGDDVGELRVLEQRF